MRSLQFVVDSLAYALVVLAAVVLSVASSMAYDDIAGVKFIRCADADTCLFELQEMPAVFERMPVRFRGIDAPEIHGKCVKEIAKAEAARKIIVTYLERAKEIKLTKVKRDKYFRLNAYIIADGINLSELLKETGYAVEYWGRGPKQDWCK